MKCATCRADTRAGTLVQSDVERVPPTCPECEEWLVLTPGGFASCPYGHGKLLPVTVEHPDHVPTLTPASVQALRRTRLDARKVSA